MATFVLRRIPNVAGEFRDCRRPLGAACRSRGGKRRRREKDKRISYQNARGEPAVELFLRKGIWLKMRRVVFAAVSGDADAIALVEQHLGVGKVAMGPHTVRHLESVIPMHVFADRAISTRIAWRNAAHRELQRLRRGTVGTDGKTRLIEFGRYAIANRRARGLGKPETFDFLGFKHYCGTRRDGAASCSEGSRWPSVCEPNFGRSRSSSWQPATTGSMGRANGLLRSCGAGWPTMLCR